MEMASVPLDAEPRDFRGVDPDMESAELINDVGRAFEVWEFLSILRRGSVIRKMMKGKCYRLSRFATNETFLLEIFKFRHEPLYIIFEAEKIHKLRNILKS